MSGNPRTISITNNGKQEFAISLDLSTLFLSNIRYAAHHREDMFDGKLKKENFEKITEMYDIQIGKPKEPEFEFDFDGRNPTMKIKSFTDSKVYDTKLFYIKKGNKLENLMDYSYGCSCEHSTYIPGKKDLSLCKHLVFGYAFLVDEADANNIGIIGSGSKSLSTYANISRKIIDMDRKLKPFEINSYFSKDMSRLSMILKENFPKS